MLSVSMDSIGERANKEVPNWGRANWSSMRQDLADTNWQQALHGKTAEEMWTTFRTRVTEVVSKNVPLRVAHNRQRPVWMTSEILRAIKQKWRLWKAAKRGRGREQYEECEHRVKKLIRNAKRNCEKRLAKGNGGNKHPFFSYIKQKTKSRPSIGPLKNEKK
jgi:hypothetical protein